MTLRDNSIPMLGVRKVELRSKVSQSIVRTKFSRSMTKIQFYTLYTYLQIAGISSWHKIHRAAQNIGQCSLQDFTVAHTIHEH